MKPHPSARGTLAQNLSYLMERNEHSSAYIGRKCRIAAKTVNNIARGRTSPQLDKIERIAQVYGLQAWQLLSPGLPQELDNGHHAGELYTAYLLANADGRKHIYAVAEREATYAKAAS